MLEVLVGQVMDNTLSTLLTMPKEWVYDTLKEIDNHTEDYEILLSDMMGRSIELEHYELCSIIKRIQDERNNN
jgi:hypothetical protein